MSITAALTGALILLVRLIKRIPRRISVFLWGIPFLRMVVPFGLDSPYSLMSLLSRITTKTVVVFQPTEGIEFSFINSVMAANSYFPITYKAKVFEDIFGVSSVIWVIVALAIFLMLEVLYITTMKEVKDATFLTRMPEVKDAAHLRGRIYYSEKVISPAVYGIVNPKIILPMSYKEQDNALVILHEETHIRSFDNLWRIVAFAVAAVHWFNPLSWIFLKCFLTDLELACDERVLSKLGEARAKEYALSLLESRKSTTVFASAFGGAKIRTRIENILSFKKMTWASLMVFIALAGVIFYVLLTNAG